MSQPVDKKTFLTIFTTVFLPMFLAAVDQTLLATATPAMVRDLGDMQLSSWIAVGYMLAGAASVPVYGWLGDQYGRKKMLAIALSIFALGSIVCALAVNMPLLVAGRIVQGLGSGGLMSLSQALIGELVPPRQRARFQGYFASLFALASIGGPVLGGVIVTYLTWHWLFWINLPLVGFALYRLSKLKSTQEKASKARIDVFGLVLFPSLMTVIIYWLSAGGHYFAWNSSMSFILLGLFAVLVVLFVTQQQRVKQSFLPLTLLAKREIHIPLISTFLFASCLFALVFFLPIFLQVGLGVSVAQSGMLMIPLSAGVICGSFITGKVISRTGVPKWVPVCGMSVSSVAFFSLAMLDLSPYTVSAIGFFCCLGLGTIMPSTQITIQTIAGKANLGRITSMAGLSRSLGASVGTAVFGTLIYSQIPGFSAESSLTALLETPREVIIDAFQAGYLLAASLAFLCLLNALRAPLIQLDDYS
ncbi:MDR family MFS transporter [Vibrio fluvialis]|uniref:MDR family MFS transporter n=1 Tax=Vibrio fluvialis TaxID=676 RepID=UPI001558755E|nr:MDR family MFS transporter [Vibrio fluvialis]EKO3494398.1 MFS transporter [Vibrio fluvialis]EKO3990359.1 MFS transporter [Vibrio fluvialis]ELV8682406.1 MFS transporter [Vibrio fluvialis]EMC0406532.1 MFS transporter [Vibrio fluvialis]MBL4237536.1 MFS transporter [Vibrio fluvialis]